MQKLSTIDPAIRHLVKLVPTVERVIAAQHARARTLPPKEQSKLLLQLDQLERQVELVRQAEAAELGLASTERM